MIEKSKIYHFLDEKHNFIIRFLDAQSLVHELALIHAGQSKEEVHKFTFFRDLVLTNAHMFSYLKHGESIGLFVDSESPFFRFKLELHEIGALRTLLLPHNFSKDVDLLSGLIRIVKFLPGQIKLYTSHIEVKGVSPSEIINEILHTSYQIQSSVLLSTQSDQSIMIEKLPPKKVDKSTEHQITLKEYLAKYQIELNKILDTNFTKEEQIHEAFSKNNYQYLHGKEVQFKCPCSKEQMVSSIASLTLTESLDEVFDNKNELESTCDYCMSRYIISRDEVDKRMTPS